MIPSNAWTTSIKGNNISFVMLGSSQQKLKVEVFLHFHKDDIIHLGSIFFIGKLWQCGYSSSRIISREMIDCVTKNVLRYV